MRKTTTQIITAIIAFLSLLSIEGLSETNMEKQIKTESLINEFEDQFNVQTLTVKELQSIPSEADYILVDVREPFEREVSIIPGSISKQEFEANMDTFKNKRIISYCTIGYRSAEYTEELTKKGFNAWNLRGSILSWLHEKGKVVDPAGKEVRKVHVYGKKWDTAPEKYETTYEKFSFLSWLKGIFK